MATPAPATSSAPPKRRSRVRRGVLYALGPLAVVLGGAWWYATGGRYVSTENAYVKFDILRVSPNVAGRVVSVRVQANQRVKKGEVLFRIDAAPFRLALAKARADMLERLNEISASLAEYRQALAELEQAQSQVTFYRKALDRQKGLSRKGIASAANLEKAQLDHQLALRRIKLLEEKVSVALARIGGDPTLSPEKHPVYLRAKSLRDQAELDLKDTVVRAPSDGIVSNLTLQVGQYVRKGVALFSMINTGKVWVDVNLKETDLTHIRPGQTAMVTVDALPDRQWRARVESIAPATGAEFAVLPPQNASGNWVKVVRRLTVRLVFMDPAARDRLRAGMSAHVQIDTGRERPLDAWMRSAFGRDKPKRPDAAK